MNLVFKVYGSLCAMDEFSINGIDADAEDFGSQEDHSPETAGDYGCGDMRFTGCDPTPSVLRKYKITKDEYDIVRRKLESDLSFGSCGWCV